MAYINRREQDLAGPLQKNDGHLKYSCCSLDHAGSYTQFWHNQLKGRCFEWIRALKPWMVYPSCFCIAGVSYCGSVCHCGKQQGPNFLFQGEHQLLFCRGCLSVSVDRSSFLLSPLYTFNRQGPIQGSAGGYYMYSYCPLWLRKTWFHSLLMSRGILIHLPLKPVLLQKDSFFTTEFMLQ